MYIEEIRYKTESIFRKYSVAYAGLFGSRARGENQNDSDTDFLIAFNKIPSLVQFIRLENELQDILGTHVDLVVQGSEKPFIKPNIYRDLIAIYGKRPTV